MRRRLEDLEGRLPLWVRLLLELVGFTAAMAVVLLALVVLSV